MKKLKSLTPEQESHIPILRKRYEDMFYNNNGIDKEACERGIEIIYKRYLDLSKPMIMYMDSPLGVHVLISTLKSMNNLKNNLEENISVNLRDNLWNNLWDNLGENLRDNLRGSLSVNLRNNLGENLRGSLSENIEENLGDNLWENLRDNLWENLSDNLSENLSDNLRENLGNNLWVNLWKNLWNNLSVNLRDNLRENLWKNLGYSKERPAQWCNIGDYGWVAFYDYLQYTAHFNEYDFTHLNDYKNLLESGIYEVYVFDGICIVCGMPRVKQDDRNRLHNTTGPAAQWKDGFSMYYYHGLNVPQHWVMDKDSITADEIHEESNAERRRALRDLMGADRYYNVLGGVVELDKDTDGRGNEMVLYESKEKDSVIDRKIQYLEVVCPSTMRTYVLYPTKECKNVWDAKSSTFNFEKIKYRHGDVGLLDLQKEFNAPIQES